MRLALLGFSPEAVRLVEAVRRDPQHELIAAFADGDEATALGRQLGLVARSDWHWLLAGDGFDAVIVAAPRVDDRRADALRKLVQNAVPLLVVHPVCSTLVALELEMIRQDTGALVVPWVPGVWHPATARVSELLQSDDCPIGTPQQVDIERAVDSPARDSVLAILARDIRLVRRIIGEIKQVTAVCPGMQQQNWENLNVTIVGCCGTLVRWSVGQVAASGSSLSVRIRGSRGRAVVTIEPAGAALQVTNAEQTCEEPMPDWDEPTEVLRRFEQALGGQQPEPTWADVCGDLEVVSAAEESLRRARTVEMLPEQYSEEQAFKGVMAISGCLLLLVAIMFLIGLAIYEGFAMTGRTASSGKSGEGTEWHWWLRFWPVYPFVLFLLFQLFRLIYRNPRGTATTGKSR